MSEDVSFKEQFVLRVKKNSEMDNVLRALMDEGELTKEEIQEIGGKARSFSALRRFSRWFDNVHVSTDFNKDGKPTSVHYTPVVPQQVQVVTSNVEFEGGTETSVQKSPTGDEVPLRWPLAPPLIEEMDDFDRPTWFSTMETMVSLGKHISLEGPPGVGKDTAVEQLAAQQGRVLVTIGGDAGFRRRDLIGTPHLSNGSSFLEVSEYAAAAVNGWWVLISEVNAADPDAIMFINTQLAPPNIVVIQGKAYPVHPDFRIFITYNAGLIGTKPLPQSFKDRFFPIKIGFFSEAQLRRRLVAMGMPEPQDEVLLYSTWQETVIKFGLAMWDAHTRGQMRYQVTTRRLSDAVTLLTDGGYTDLRAALRDAVISAIDSPVEEKAADQVLKNVVPAGTEVVNG